MSGRRMNLSDYERITKSMLNNYDKNLVQAVQIRAGSTLASDVVMVEERQHVNINSIVFLTIIAVIGTVVGLIKGAGFKRITKFLRKLPVFLIVVTFLENYLDKIWEFLKNHLLDYKILAELAYYLSNIINIDMDGNDDKDWEKLIEDAKQRAKEKVAETIEGLE